MGELERNLLTGAFLIGMLCGGVIGAIVNAVLESRRRKYESDN